MINKHESCGVVFCVRLPFRGHLSWQRTRVWSEEPQSGSWCYLSEREMAADELKLICFCQCGGTRLCSYYSAASGIHFGINTFSEVGVMNSPNTVKWVFLKTWFCVSRIHIIGLMTWPTDGFHLTTGLTLHHFQYLLMLGESVQLNRTSRARISWIWFMIWYLECDSTAELIKCALYRGKGKAVLVFEGVDTVSTISLNGLTIGKTDNMFRRYVNE